MKKLFLSTLMIALMLGSVTAQKQYKYETVPNDPIKARIYTLDNGLKVYMSVYKDQPTIKITIATKAGSKNDPAETTGLAHYFEHLMFKGTQHFGTKDYAKEEPLLNEIERLFEEYRKIDESNTAERKALYKQIDSVSQLAAQYAIPNEYDKLMSAIGSTGTNAATWIDFTNYYEEIPSNQLDNFFYIQADRFQYPVLRLFHTELETIYEEKNMTLTQDRRRASAALMEALFPHHPYGTQTTIGTQKDLRNPSITNVKAFFDKFYVPNNMAIIMAGDFDPDEAIKIVDKYMGQLKYKEVPAFKFTPEAPITSPIVKEVVGKDAEYVYLAWRFGNPNSAEIPLLIMADMILTNGYAGLVDLNINQKQRCLNAGSSPAMLHDYSYLQMYGSPKAGQTLEEVKDILLEQIEKLANGDFPEWLLEASINEMRKREMNEIESNEGRVDMMEESFYLDIPWKDQVNQYDELAKITKQQIMDFAKKYLTKDNYVVVYKRKGKANDIDKVKKPKATPIKINREDKSAFVADLESRKVKDIEPVYLDLQKDIKMLPAQNGVSVYYTKNEDNELFTLSYVFEMGTNNDKYLNYASSYLEYLGTDRYTPEQIKEELYRLGCNFSMSASGDRSYVTMAGLSKNMPEVMRLLEHIINNAKPNQEAWDNMISDVLKNRENAKSNQGSITSRLVSYGIYGPQNPGLALQLSEKELKALTPEQMIAKLQEWIKYKHYAIYYGPLTPSQVIEAIDNIHNPKDLNDVPAPLAIKEDVQTKDRVLIAHYDAPQMVVYAVSFGEKFNPELSPVIDLYNNYFGGSMNSIVFQELREARALAYTAAAGYSQPSRLDRLSTNVSYIGCGNDKIAQSIDAFKELYANMPENENSFNLAKEAAIKSIRTERITKASKVWTYLYLKRMGLNKDPREAEFNALPNLTFNDIKNFQQKYITGKPTTYMIVGDTKAMDMKYLKKLGKVKVLKLETIFGY